MSRREDSKQSRMAVPALPMPCAIILCILNILVPGLGTFLSAFSMCCCGNKRDLTGGDICIAGCIQVLIAFGQLICTPFFLLGWIWSIIWGIAFIGQSNDFYHNDPGTTDNQNPPGAGAAFGTSITFGRVQRVQPIPATAPPPYSGPTPNFVTQQVPAYTEPPPQYHEIFPPPASNATPSAPPQQLMVQPHMPTASGALPHSGNLS